MPKFSDINKVEQEMEDIREQMELGNEISTAISNPVGMGHEVGDSILAPVYSLVAYCSASDGRG